MQLQMAVCNHIFLLYVNLLCQCNCKSNEFKRCRLWPHQYIVVKITAVFNCYQFMDPGGMNGMVGRCASTQDHMKSLYQTSHNPQKHSILQMSNEYVFII